VSLGKIIHNEISEKPIGNIHSTLRIFSYADSDGYLKGRERPGAITYLTSCNLIIIISDNFVVILWLVK
jgi:hypothetical protein